MKTLIVLSLIALTVVGVAGAADAAPTCHDLGGQGYACYEVVADPAGGNVDVDVLVVVEPGV